MTIHNDLRCRRCCAGATVAGAGKPTENSAYFYNDRRVQAAITGNAPVQMIGTQSKRIHTRKNNCKRQPAANDNSQRRPVPRGDKETVQWRDYQFTTTSGAAGAARGLLPPARAPQATAQKKGVRKRRLSLYKTQPPTWPKPSLRPSCARQNKNPTHSMQLHWVPVPQKERAPSDTSPDCFLP